MHTGNMGTGDLLCPSNVSCLTQGGPSHSAANLRGPKGRGPRGCLSRTHNRGLALNGHDPDFTEIVPEALTKSGIKR